LAGGFRIFDYESSQDRYRGATVRANPVATILRRQTNRDQVKLSLQFVGMIHYGHQGISRFSFLSISDSAIRGRPIRAVGSADWMLSSSAMPRLSAFALPAQS